MKTIRRSAVLIAVVALVTLAAPSLASTAGAATVPTRHLTASGGTIKWTVAVHNAKRCTWSSSPTVTGFNGTATCTNGRAVRPATFKTNTSSVAKDYTLTVVIRGATTTVDHLKVVQAAGGGTTTGKPTTYCIGPSSCYYQLPAPDIFDLTALQVGYVVTNVACPDPGVCDQPAGDQLDEMILAFTVGSSGMSQPGIEASNFALILSDGSQAHQDSITCDNSVQYALCGLGAEAANATFGGEIFFDVPTGENWSTVNFRYTSAQGTEVMVFRHP
jgi:hypothetical protein